MGDIRRFVANKDTNKRDLEIARLISDPLHAHTWATRMCEISGSRDVGSVEQSLGTGHEEKWYAWFQVRFARNEPNDALVRQIRVATTRDKLSADEYVNQLIESNQHSTLCVVPTAGTACEFNRRFNRVRADRRWRSSIEFTKLLTIERSVKALLRCFLASRTEGPLSPEYRGEGEQEKQWNQK